MALNGSCIRWDCGCGNMTFSVNHRNMFIHHPHFLPALASVLLLNDYAFKHGFYTGVLNLKLTSMVCRRNSLSSCVQCILHAVQPPSITLRPPQDWLRTEKSTRHFSSSFIYYAMEQEDRPSKRVKLSATDQQPEPTEAIPTAVANGLASLHRSITPPPSSRPRRESSVPQTSIQSADLTSRGPQVIPSPIQLTHIRDLSVASGNNVDTVRLKDILGDPMIRECWQFNFLFDVDFLMSQFDEDVRRLVQVKVVHGSWKKDAPNRIRIEVCFSFISRQYLVCVMKMLTNAGSMSSVCEC